MKKLLSLLLALAMCAALAACGGGEDEPAAPSTPASEPSAPVESAGGDTGSNTDTDSGSDTDTGGEGAVYTDYELLGQVDVYSAFTPDQLAGTVWEFSGGFTDGQELTDEDAASVLEMYGGTLQIVFSDEESADLVQGGGSMPGTYRLLDDGITLNFSFALQGEEYTYAAVFTTVGGEDNADASDAVLVLVADADPTTALYMTPASEG